MSALSEALTAAQRRAIAAGEKAYVAGAIDHEGLMTLLDEMGCTDKIEQGYLWAALETLKQLGASAPAENGAPPPDKPISDKQRQFIARLADERGYPTPELAGLTSVQASEMIGQLQAGTFDPAAWDMPF